MTYQVQDGAGTPRIFSSTTNPQDGNSLVGSTCVTDPVSGDKAKVSGTGYQFVTSDGPAKTYRAAVLDYTPVATPTDAFVIKGSATKTVRIKKIRLSGVATAQGNMPVQLVKRSTAGTLGSAVLTALTAVPHDRTDAAATAVVSSVGTANYTTPGTLVGAIDVGRLSMPAVSTGGAGDAEALSFDFCRNEDKAIVLHGDSDFLCVNFNGAAVPAGGKIDFMVEFEEDLS